ncbi:MAG TPA: DUF4177 domain-containing protein [Chloroflexi bacterium]|nr:DUF4177 domain-containing protein [Chloroflexota bacterium]HHW84669.1 DUF4177 domain-containing protein [Chloroflexota bacterium]
MFEYQFLTVAAEVGKTPKDRPPLYQQTIQEQARRGWRLVQVFVPVPAAVPSEYVLIFERPAQSQA